MRWLTIEHADTGGRGVIGDLPGVRELHEARGWEVVGEHDPDAVDAPEDAAPNLPADEPEDTPPEADEPATEERNGVNG